MEMRMLHNAPEYYERCADILNEEWPRSKTARFVIGACINNCIYEWNY